MVLGFTWQWLFGYGKGSHMHYFTLYEIIHSTIYFPKNSSVANFPFNCAYLGIKQFHRLVPIHPLPHKTFQEKVNNVKKNIKYM